MKKNVDNTSKEVKWADLHVYSHCDILQPALTASYILFTQHGPESAAWIPDRIVDETYIQRLPIQEQKCLQ